MAIEKRNTELTKSRLLDAAAELIARRGFDGTTTDTIARRAGVNKAMISYHFGGKQGLYTALLERILGGIAERLEAVRAWQAAPEQRLTAFIAAFREMIRIYPMAPQLMVRETISGGRHIDKRVLPSFLRVFTVLQEILDQGAREGRFRTVNPLLTHIGLVGSLLFFFATETFRKRVVRETGLQSVPMDREDYIRHWREMILGGLYIRPLGGATLHTDSGPPVRDPDAAEEGRGIR